MQDSVKAWQPLIQQEIEKIIDDFAREHVRFPLDQKQLSYLKEIAAKGKQFRGCLLAGFCDRVKPLPESQKKTVARLAAALELYGTAILIQDDIIDHSTTRRGIASVHAYMQGVAQRAELQPAQHFGVAAAICLANVLYFVADMVVTELDVPEETKAQLAVINSQELALVSLAEIEDVRLSSSASHFSKQDILHMFRGKTGGYTGKWPLALACIVAGIDQEVREKISEIGEQIGVLYQLKDDELGIFGKEEETGKSATADILEGKKTLYYWYLQQLPEAEKNKVFAVVGNLEASATEVDLIKQTIEQLGISKQVSAEMEELKETIQGKIIALPIPEKAQTFLSEVTDFVVTRNK